VAKKDKNELEEFFSLMEEENLHELEIKQGSFQVKLVKDPRYHQMAMALLNSPPVSKKSAKQPEKTEEKGLTVKSPLAGVFYRARSPQSPPFVKEGDSVTPEKTLCIVEAMKVMNEINAGCSGKILKILVENGKPVEANQTLFLVESA